MAEIVRVNNVALVSQLIANLKDISSGSDKKSKKSIESIIKDLENIEKKNTEFDFSNFIDSLAQKKDKSQLDFMSKSIAEITRFEKSLERLFVDVLDRAPTDLGNQPNNNAMTNFRDRTSKFKSDKKAQRIAENKNTDDGNKFFSDDLFYDFMVSMRQFVTMETNQAKKQDLHNLAEKFSDYYHKEKETDGSINFSKLIIDWAKGSQDDIKSLQLFRDNSSKILKSAPRSEVVTSKFNKALDAAAKAEKDNDELLKFTDKTKAAKATMGDIDKAMESSMAEFSQGISEIARAMDRIDNEFSSMYTNMTLYANGFMKIGSGFITSVKAAGEALKKNADGSRGGFMLFLNKLAAGLAAMFAGGIAILAAGVSKYFDRLNSARNIAGGNSRTVDMLVKSIGTIRINSLLSEEEIMKLNDTLGENFGISLTKNQAKFEQLASKQHGLMRRMGKEYAEQQAEAVAELQSTLKSTSAAGMMDELADSTSVLAKTLGISNKAALQHIKLLAENTKLIGKTLSKDEQAAIADAFKKQLAGLKALGLSDEAIKELQKGVSEDLADKQKTMEEFNKLNTVANSGGQGSQMMQEKLNQMGMSMDDAAKLYQKAATSGTESLSIEERNKLIELQTANKLAQSVEASDARDKQEFDKTMAYKNLNYAEVEGAADSMKKHGGGKQMAKVMKSGEKDLQANADSEKAKRVLEKVAVSKGAKDVDSRDKKVSEMLSTIQLTEEEKKKQDEYYKNSLITMLRDNGKSDAETQGKSISELESLAKSSDKEGVTKVQKMKDDAKLAAASDQIVKASESLDKGQSAKIGSENVSATEYKNVTESDLAKGDSKAVENSADAIKRQMIKAEEGILRGIDASQKSIADSINKVLPFLQKIADFVASNAGTIVKAIIGLTAVVGAFALAIIGLKAIMMAGRVFAAFGGMAAAAGGFLNGLFNKNETSQSRANPDLKGKEPPKPGSMADKFRKGTDAGVKVKEGAASLGSRIKDGVSSIGSKMAGIGGKIMESPIIKGLGSSLKVIGKFGGPIVMGLMAIYDGFTGWNDAGKIFGTEMPTLGQKMSSAFGSIVSGLSFGLISTESIAKWTYNVSNWIGEKTSKMFKGIGDFFGMIGEKVKNSFNELKDLAGKVFNDIVSIILMPSRFIFSLFSDGLSGFGEKLSGAASTVGDAIAAYPKFIVNLFSNALTSVINIFGNLMMNLKGWWQNFSFGDMLKSIGSGIADMAIKVRDIIGNALKDIFYTIIDTIPGGKKIAEKLGVLKPGEMEKWKADKAAAEKAQQQSTTQKTTIPPSPTNSTPQQQKSTTPVKTEQTKPKAKEGSVPPPKNDTKAPSQQLAEKPQGLRDDFFKLATDSQNHKGLVDQNRTDASKSKDIMTNLANSQGVYDAAGGSGAVTLTSGFRNKELNAAVGSKAAHSAHLEGRAIDMQLKAGGSSDQDYVDLAKKIDSNLRADDPAKANKMKYLVESDGSKKWLHSEVRKGDQLKPEMLQFDAKTNKATGTIDVASGATSGSTSKASPSNQLQGAKTTGDYTSVENMSEEEKTKYINEKLTNLRKMFGGGTTADTNKPLNLGMNTNFNAKPGEKLTNLAQVPVNSAQAPTSSDKSPAAAIQNLNKSDIKKAETELTKQSNEDKKTEDGNKKTVSDINKTNADAKDKQKTDDDQLISDFSEFGNKFISYNKLIYNMLNKIVSVDSSSNTNKVDTSGLTQTSGMVTNAHNVEGGLITANAVLAKSVNRVSNQFDKKPTADTEKDYAKEYQAVMESINTLMSENNRLTMDASQRLGQTNDVMKSKLLVDSRKYKQDTDNNSATPSQRLSGLGGNL